MSTSAMAALAAPRRRKHTLRWVTIGSGAVLVVLTYFPIVFVLSNSLKSGENISSNGVFALFTQFDVHNYVQAWSGIDTSLLNTVIVAVAAIVIGVVAAVLGAYAFAQLQFRGKSVVFMAYLGLLMIPWTLTIIPLFLLMKTFGFYNGGWALILPSAASAQPLLVLLFRGFFEQIPDELLQSARLDGAREWQGVPPGGGPPTPPATPTGRGAM